MSFSSIILSCHHCSQRLGSLNIEDISLLSAQQVISFLVNNKVGILCQECSCEHEFTDTRVKLRSTAGETTIAQREQ